MSRVLLIGRGPLPRDDETVLGFSQLRTAHFSEALQAADHQVRIALLVSEAPCPAPQDWEGVYPVVEEGPAWLEQISDLAKGADVIVSAGPYNPGRAACLVAEDLPVWADLPGDPFAELHALAAATKGGLSEERVIAAEAAILPVLARADAISVISGPQRHALHGQLGALGRLLPSALPEVHTVPIAHFSQAPALAPRSREAGSPLVVALSGGFNPWFDDQSAAQGLETALSLVPGLEVLVTGGNLPGFFTQGWERFSAWATTSQWKDRITLHGWIEQGDLPSVLQRAHVGLSLDMPGPEPELGSRTRLLFFTQMGLFPVASATCELAREMAALGELWAVAPSNPTLLAHTLREISDAPSGPIQASVLDAQVRLARDYEPNLIAAPMVAWAADPARTTPADLPAAALAVQLAEERDALAQVHASPTWRTLSRLHRLVRRD
jgi:hypothetical protein